VLRALVLSLLLLAAPAFADRDCDWAPPEAMRCCKEHAIKYVIGGTEAQRESADRRLYYCMVVRGVDKDLARGIRNIIRRHAGRECPPGAWGCWRYPSNLAQPYHFATDRLGWSLSYRRR